MSLGSMFCQDVQMALRLQIPVPNVPRLPCSAGHSPRARGRLPSTWLGSASCFSPGKSDSHWAGGRGGGEAAVTHLF